jgi:2-hydroxy-6-oxonona-2,4-dienedioate hydrolase
LEPAPPNGVRSVTPGPAVHGNAADARIERYRHAETKLWKHYGLEPTEHFVDLQSPRVRVRVQVVGSGPAILFIHGGVWPGAAFASLIRELRGFRCVIFDRPGCGLSSALDYSKYAHKTLITQLLTGVLDAVGIERAHVVGQEVGAAWALGLAAAHPARLDRLVLMGAAPLLHEQPVPTFLKVLASPIGALIVRLPQSRGQARSILRQDGHGASVEAEQIPDAYLDWHVALMRETPTMRNERALIRATLGRGGWRPEVTFEASELARLQQPMLYVYGTNDPESTVDRVRHVVGLLPAAELHLIEGAGHLPWLDDPGQVGARVSGFLAG